MQYYLVYFALCLLIGSLPVGEIVARLFKGKSLIQKGTRSTLPPSEVFELLGATACMIVNIIDGLKGFVAVYPLATYFIGPEPYRMWWVVTFGGLLTVIGHCNSFILGFKGGRGLMPTFGVMVTLLPYPAILASLLGFFLGFWGLSTKPGALSAAGAMPLLSIAWVLLLKPEDLYYLYIVAFMSLWTIWEHRSEFKNYLGLSASTSPTLPGNNSAIENADDAENIEN